jgi:uncharacterized protein (TIGR00725 family)
MDDRQQPPLIIAVIGGSEPSKEAAAAAYEVGRELAMRGAIVVCGGLEGVMEAVCRGAKEAGGTTVGILPGDHPAESNPYVDIPIATGLGYARNAIVAKAGLAVIAIDGSYGTLSEIGHALADFKPVVGLGTWSFSTSEGEDTSVHRVNDPAEAAEKAVALAQERRESAAEARP